MNTSHYFITGASGCIGHYLLDDLLQSTTGHLDCLIRNPAKLAAQYHNHPRITLHQGSLDQVEAHQDLVKTCDVMIHIATAWHDDDYSMQINYHKTLEMFRYAAEGRCKKIIYFSTASILGRDNKPNPDALKLGPMYIKSKYRAHEAMQTLTDTPPIYTLFPTLVMGGNKQVPYSHISGGIKDHQRYVKIARFLSAKGQFHFMHGKDIASVTTHLVINDEDQKEFVLGQQKITVKQGICDINRACGNRVYWQFPLNNRFVVKLAKLLGVKFDPWGEYCALNHDQSYQVTNPGDFNRTNYFPTIGDAVLDIEGIKN